MRNRISACLSLCCALAAAPQPGPPKALLDRAGKGDVGAQYQIGKMYRDGAGVVPNAAEAARWFRQAAAAGLAQAENDLGFLYDSGLGLPEDHAEASGRGAPQDDVAAYTWMDVAAFRARGTLQERCVMERDALAAKLTPEQLAEAQRRALLWKKKWLR
jgi:uncharacterized protein